MIAIDEDQSTIRLTRGDATHEDYNTLPFYFPIWNEAQQTETNYSFKTTDKITFVVYEKKGFTKREILKIEKTIQQLGYNTATTTPSLVLTSADTMKFPESNKQQTYWYSIILNDDTTIVGMDEDGAKKLVVYPNGV